jgi:hypothetical protein
VTLLIFLHLPRTAGTTFASILRRLYGPDAVLELYGAGPEEGWDALAPEAAARIRVVTGHFAFGVHERLPQPSRYITFLRDPVDRVISHYRYVRSQPGHDLHDAAMRFGLAEYVESCGAYEPNNDQTRLWAGTELGPSNAEMLPAAERNLAGAVIGLTEAFDASIVSMSRTFGWRLPFYVRRNATPDASSGALDPEVREHIRSRNALDAELYDHAVERFGQEIDRLGDGFARDVRAFRRLNAVYRMVRRPSRPAA